MKEYDLAGSNGKGGATRRGMIWFWTVAAAVVLVVGGIGPVAVSGSGCNDRHGHDKTGHWKSGRRARHGSRAGARMSRSWGRGRRSWGRRHHRHGGRWHRKVSPKVRPGEIGTVIHVVDGDTVWVRLHASGQVIKLRLAGANAPECHKMFVKLPGGRSSARCRADDEFFGYQSYVIMRDLVASKQVTLGCRAGSDGFCPTGSYGRPLLSMTVDGKDVAEELVVRGAAWPFTKYKDQHLAKYCRAEERAWKHKAGMWKAGTRWQVMARMSKKTQKWYRLRDARCRRLTHGG